MQICFPICRRVKVNHSVNQVYIDLENVRAAVPLSHVRPIFSENKMCVLIAKRLNFCLRVRRQTTRETVALRDTVCFGVDTLLERLIVVEGGGNKQTEKNRNERADYAEHGV